MCRENHCTKLCKNTADPYFITALISSSISGLTNWDSTGAVLTDSAGGNVKRRAAIWCQLREGAKLYVFFKSRVLTADGSTLAYRGRLGSRPYKTIHSIRPVINESRNQEKKHIPGQQQNQI